MVLDKLNKMNEDFSSFLKSMMVTVRGIDE